MKAPTSAIRFKDASNLLDYGFSNFEYKSLVNKQTVIKTIKVNKGIEPTVNAVSQSELGCIVAKGNDIGIEQKITIDDVVNAPIAKDNVIGKITFTLNSEVLAECNLLAEKSIPKMNFITMNNYLLKKWSSLLRIGY